jgi:hypothetical protein
MRKLLRDNGFPLALGALCLLLSLLIYVIDEWSNVADGAAARAVATSTTPAGDGSQATKAVAGRSSQPGRVVKKLEPNSTAPHGPDETDSFMAPVEWKNAR